MSFSPTGLDRIYILDRSGVAVSTPANSTLETPLAQILIPGGAMGVNGVLEIYSHWSFTSSGNNKTIRMRLGGMGSTAFGTLAAGANTRASMIVVIMNRGTANSQCGADGTSGGVGVSNGAIVTASIDTTQDQVLVLSGQKSSGSDTLTLDMYMVKLITRA